MRKILLSLGIMLTLMLCACKGGSTDTTNTTESAASSGSSTAAVTTARTETAAVTVPETKISGTSGSTTETIAAGSVVSDADPEIAVPLQTGVEILPGGNELPVLPPEESPALTGKAPTVTAPAETYAIDVPAETYIELPFIPVN